MPTLVLGQPIGSGGFGCVYRAEKAGTICAAKKCSATLAELSQAAVKREVDILLQLRHRHVIQYFDTVNYEGHTYILMDLAEKGSLAGAIARGDVNDWPTKKRIAHEIARGLEYIHHYDILHRDLKTDNVLLTRYMEVKLCDFGLAKVKTLSASSSTDTFKGTLRWAAPEALELRPKYSKKSDIYSLGMVMWALAANRPKPFEEQHVNKVIIAHVQSGEREVIPEITPPEYRMWIEKCWHQDPKQRPRASEVTLVEEDSLVVMPSDAWVTTFSLDFSTDESVRDKYVEYKPIDMFEKLTFVDRIQENNQQSTQCDDAVLVYLKRKASEGDADAQLFLGWVYEQGLGLERTSKDALNWYRKAADQGHGTAQLKLGLSYECNGGDNQRHDDSEAVKWYRKAASNGDAQAQLRLGLLCAYGRGVSQNDVEAAKWFQQSALHGVADAQFNIALMYSRGQGVDQSDSEAAKWMRKAADQDLPEAQFGFGSMYYGGRGVDRSDEKAFMWYSYAARNGHSDAQVKLGSMYENGRGVQKNEPEAISWYFKAAAQKFPMAESILFSKFFCGTVSLTGEMVDACHEVARQENVLAQRILGDLYRDGSDVKEDNAEAATWYRKAADQGDIYAQHRLALLYLIGRGVQQSDDEALAWYRKSRGLCGAQAELEIGKLFEYGQGVARSNTKAATWYRKGADQGDRDAQRILGDIYKDGRGVTQSYIQAATWYRKAADQGDPDAQRRLGLMYLNGRGVQQSDDEALAWYRKALGSCGALAEVEIGNLYEYGQGVEQSNTKATAWYCKADAWYREAADQGDLDAKRILGDFYKNGRRVEQDDVEAATWYSTVVFQGGENSQQHSGSMYLNGRGVQQSDDEEFAWYRKISGHINGGEDKKTSRLWPWN